VWLIQHWPYLRCETGEFRGIQSSTCMFLILFNFNFIDLFLIDIHSRPQCRRLPSRVRLEAYKCHGHWHGLSRTIQIAKFEEEIDMLLKSEAATADAAKTSRSIS